MAPRREDRQRGQGEKDWLSPFDRDLDRLTYSSAWRRMAGITQVVPDGGRSSLHNRMTHSEKVGRTGQRSAQFLLWKNRDNPGLRQVLDPTVLLTAGYLHDLGHAPFGHIGEAQLQQCLQSGPAEFRLADSFEGNAQTFRIVTKLSSRKSDRNRPGSSDGYGLNLTRATLLATSKYPWCKGEFSQELPEAEQKYYVKKWGAYEPERAEMEFARELLPAGAMQSIEAQLMDWADDITYAIHDIEDFFRANVIPLHEIGLGLAAGAGRRGESEEFRQFWSYATESLSLKQHIEFDATTARRTLARYSAAFPGRQYSDSDEDRVALHKFSSELINAFQTKLAVSADLKLIIPPATRMAVEALKELTWYYVVENPAVTDMQHGQRRIISSLHTWLCELVKSAYDGSQTSTQARNDSRRKKRRISPRLSRLVEIAFTERGGSLALTTEGQKISRAVTDFIASLTENEAIDIYLRMNGGEGAVRSPFTVSR